MRGFERRGVFRAHECTIARPEEEILFDEHPQKRFAGLLIKVPEPPRLRLGQAEARHLEKLALYSSEYVFSCTVPL